jgi:hypothetical protein
MTPVLNRLLTVQLLIHKRVSGIVSDNDDEGCCDWIISDIAIASLRRIGYSKNSVKLLGSLRAQLEHHVSTGLGVSDKSCSIALEKLMYGIRQGSCSSPIIWSLLNQLLLVALGEEFDCIHLVSIDGTSDTTRRGDSFVDDTTTGSTTDDCSTEPTDKDIKELTKEE